MTTNEKINAMLQYLQDIYDNLEAVYYEGEELLCWAKCNDDDSIEALNNYLKKINSRDHQANIDYGNLLYWQGIPFILEYTQNEICALIGDEFFDSEIQEKFQDLKTGLYRIQSQILKIAEQMENIIGHEYIEENDEDDDFF